MVYGGDFPAAPPRTPTTGATLFEQYNAITASDIAALEKASGKDVIGPHTYHIVFAMHRAGLHASSDESGSSTTSNDAMRDYYSNYYQKFATFEQAFPHLAIHEHTHDKEAAHEQMSYVEREKMRDPATLKMHEQLLEESIKSATLLKAQLSQPDDITHMQDYIASLQDILAQNLELQNTITQQNARTHTPHLQR